MKTLIAAKSALAGISFRHSAVHLLTPRQADLLHDYVSLPDGLMKQLIDQVNDLGNHPDNQHICLAYAPKPIVLAPSDYYTRDDKDEQTRTRIVGWSMLRKIHDNKPYLTFHERSPHGSYEMMAFVVPEKRELGVAKACCAKILSKHRVPTDANIVVFRDTMKKILKGLGYENVRNVLS